MSRRTREERKKKEAKSIDMSDWGLGLRTHKKQPHTLDGDACLLAPLLLSLLVCVYLCHRVSVAAVAGGQETVTQERKEEAREKKRRKEAVPFHSVQSLSLFSLFLSRPLNQMPCALGAGIVIKSELPNLTRG